jgi:hypothetical protein
MSMILKATGIVAEVKKPREKELGAPSSHLIRRDGTKVEFGVD